MNKHLLQLPPIGQIPPTGQNNAAHTGTFKTLPTDGSTHSQITTKDRYNLEIYQLT